MSAARAVNQAMAVIDTFIVAALLNAGSTSWTVVPVLLIEVGQAIGSLLAEPGEVVGGWLGGYLVPVATSFVLLGMDRAGHPLAPALTLTGHVVVAAGWLLSIGGLASLGRGFSVLPQTRDKVRRSGLYGVVPHPIYTGYICTAIGTLLMDWSPLRTAVVLLFCAGTALRVALEDVALGRPPRSAWRRSVCRVFGVKPTLTAPGT